MQSWDSTRTPAFLQASSTESVEPRTWSTSPRTTFSTDFRGFRCLFSRLSAVGNMRSAQQAAFERAFTARSCSWQAFKQSMNVGPPSEPINSSASSLTAVSTNFSTRYFTRVTARTIHGQRSPAACGRTPPSDTPAKSGCIQ